MLGPQHRPPGIIQTRPHHVGQELDLQLFGGLLLPALPLVWFWFLLNSKRGDGQLCPGGHFQAGLVHQPSALPHRLEQGQFPPDAESWSPQ